MCRQAEEIGLECAEARTARGDRCGSSACIRDQVSQSKRDFRPARGEAADLNTHSCRSSSV